MIALGILLGCLASYLTVGLAVACVDAGLHPELYPAHDDLPSVVVAMVLIWPAVLVDWLARPKP